MVLNLRKFITIFLCVLTISVIVDAIAVVIGGVPKTAENVIGMILMKLH